MWYPVFLIAFIILYFVFTLPKVKGYLGELTVRIVLLFLNSKDFIVFNNVYFPAYNGLFMQIDHMVICRGCVIVVETKNYNGQIEGDWRRKYWTVRKKGYSHKAYNPMRQNSYHVRMLRENNIVPEYIRIYPVVCLGLFAKAETAGKMPVVTPLQLIECVKKTVGVVSINSDLNLIAEKIKDLLINGSSTGREHVRKLKNLKIKKNEGRCPRCGGRLFYRNSLRGRIAICTNYPWCKYRNKTYNLKN